VVYAVGDPSALEDETVGQVVTDVQIVDGQIRVFFGPCCWKDLGSIAEIVRDDDEGDIENPWDDVEGEAPVYSACAKANAIVDATYRLVECAYDQIDNAPWQYLSNIEGCFGYNLDDTHVIRMMSAVMFFYLTQNVTWNDVNDADIRQAVKARVEPLLADDNTGVATDELFTRIKDAFGYEMNFVNYVGVFQYALDSIGRRDLDEIAKLGSRQYEGEDCAAPVAPYFEGMVPVGLDWLYGWDFRDAQGDWYLNDAAWHRYESGVGFWAKPSTTDNRCSINVRLTLDQINNGSTATWVAVVLETLGDENWDNNYVFAGVQGATDLMYADVIAKTGENPAIPGFHQIGAPTANPMSAGDVLLQIQMAAYHPDPGNQHPDEYAYSQRIVAFAIGGTGPGPLASPPAWPFT
jgi:hypothetical protein